MGEVRFRRRLAVVVVGAALLRLWRLAVLWGRPLQLNDSLYYSAQARALAAGRLFPDPFAPFPGAQHGPVTPLVMAAVSWIDDPIPWQRAVTVPFGIVTVLFIGLAARRVGGPRAGLAAAAIAAVYPNLWLSDGLVMSESIAVCVVSILLWMSVSRTPHSAARCAAIGAVVGLAALTRSELVLIAPLVGFVVGRAPTARSTSLRAAVACAGALLVVAPWSLFNLTRFERPVLLTTNEGALILGTNTPETYFGPDIGGWSLPRLIEEMEARPDIAILDPSARSEHMRAVGLAYARTYWKQVPIVMAARLGRLIDVYGIESQLRQDEGEDRGRVGPMIGVATFWLLASLAVSGARQLWRTGRRRWLGVIASPLVVAVVVAVVFYGTHRLRAVAEPSIVVLSAVALAGWRPRIPDDAAPQRPRSRTIIE